MPSTAVRHRPGFLDGPLRLYIGGERVSTYLTSKSVWVDLQSAVTRAGQAISR